MEKQFIDYLEGRKSIRDYSIFDIVEFDDEDIKTLIKNYSGYKLSENALDDLIGEVKFDSINVNTKAKKINVVYIIGGWDHTDYEASIAKLIIVFDLDKNTIHVEWGEQIKAFEVKSGEDLGEAVDRMEAHFERL